MPLLRSEAAEKAAADEKLRQEPSPVSLQMLRSWMLTRAGFASSLRLWLMTLMLTLLASETALSLAQTPSRPNARLPKQLRLRN